MDGALGVLHDDHFLVLDHRLGGEQRDDRLHAGGGRRRSGLRARVGGCAQQRRDWSLAFLSRQMARLWLEEVAADSWAGSVFKIR